MSRLVDHLRGYGDRVAVLTETTTLTYRELADRVAAAAAELGGTRRLVVLETRNDLSTLVHYLGALAGDHVVLPMSAGRGHSAVLRPMIPTSSSTAPASTNAGREAHTGCIRTSPSAVDLGQHRIAEAGPAVPLQSGRECDRDRRIS